MFPNQSPFLSVKTCRFSPRPPGFEAPHEHLEWTAEPPGPAMEGSVLGRNLDQQRLGRWSVQPGMKHEWNMDETCMEHGETTGMTGEN